jgi:hypothetical protein
VILGAARSGTKLLRRLLGQSADCTVISYPLNTLWRTGLSPAASDRRTADEGTPRIARNIRSTLRTLAEPSTPYLVEKTCANTLRVPFVNRVLPDAQFVHILRDGRDVAVSARNAWREGPSFDDALRKLRTVLATDPPSLLWHARNWWGGRDTPAVWGPRYPSIERDLREMSLLEVCARQWRSCVETCLDDLSSISDRRIVSIRYEALVSDRTVLDRLVDALELKTPSPVRAYYDDVVHANSVGRWRRCLSSEEKERLTRRLRPLLDRLDLERPAT